MSWFKRKEKGIQTPTGEKKDVPKGLWYKSPTGKIIDTEELAKNLWVSPEDDFHVRMPIAVKRIVGAAGKPAHRPRPHRHVGRSALCQRRRRRRVRSRQSASARRPPVAPHGGLVPAVP